LGRDRIRRQCNEHLSRLTSFILQHDGVAHYVALGQRIDRIANRNFSDAFSADRPITTVI